MTRPPLSEATAEVLLGIHWRDAEGTWWHDLPHPQRKALLDRGLIRDNGERTRCGTPGHHHPGYVVVTEEGAHVVDQLRASAEPKRCGNCGRALDPEGACRGGCGARDAEGANLDDGEGLDECADCGESTAEGTPCPHVCGSEALAAVLAQVEDLDRPAKLATLRRALAIVEAVAT